MATIFVVDIDDDDDDDVVVVVVNLQLLSLCTSDVLQ
jgi:hypothetical protein